MSEKKRYIVYLDNWMINTGIIGFLNILLTEKEKSFIIENYDKDELLFRGERIRISHNILEFDNDVLADNGNFAKLFFQKSFEQYGRYGRFMMRLEDIKVLIEQYFKQGDQDEKNRIKKRIINLWEYKGSFSFLEKKYEEIVGDKLKLNNKLTDNSFDNDKLSDLLLIINNCLNVLNMEEYHQEFVENDVQYYLSSHFADDKAGIKKQSGFLNVSVTGSKQEHFFKNLIEPIIIDNVDIEKDYHCIIDNLRLAKKKSTYNSGLVPFLGHPGKENYYWLNTPNKLPLCEIYELIYWCTFAGFTDITKGTNIRFLFCNQDTSIIDLWISNYKLQTEFSSNEDISQPYMRFLSNLILSEKEKSSYELQNTTLIDINNTKEFYVKIHSLYISREKALFLKNEKVNNKLTALSKTNFNDKGINKSIGLVVLERILQSNLNYDFLHYLTKQALSDNKEAVYIQRQLERVNYLILSYHHSFLNRSGYMKLLNNKERYDVYEHGRKVATRIRAGNDENKIRGMVYKFLGYQKTGNINSFMNLFMRIHMAYSLQTPTELIKSMDNEISFNAFGYSFINGLLNINNEEIQDKGE